MYNPTGGPIKRVEVRLKYDRIDVCGPVLSNQGFFLGLEPLILSQPTELLDLSKNR